MRLLIVDDETELSNAVKTVFTHNHYTADIIRNGLDALEILKSSRYDAVILSILIPMFNGLYVVEEMRKRDDFTPVLIISSSSDINDKIKSFEKGADDYIVKPFDMRELVVRVNALTRRYNGFKTQFSEYKGLKLDHSTHIMSYKGKKVKLSNKEFAIIELMLSKPGWVISTEQILKHVWGNNSEERINVVWVYISSLRKKLDEINSDITLKAARSIGYCLSEKS